MGFTRRDCLGAATAAAALGGFGLPGCALRSGSGPRPFLHGVASGDPLADRVVLWTRVTPRPGRTWYFGFEALGQASSVGRTRTLPVGRTRLSGRDVQVARDVLAPFSLLPPTV